jgi:hypothetical protein
MQPRFIPLLDYKQTGNEIYDIAKDCYFDLDHFGLLDCSMQRIFDTVKNIPYIEDVRGYEILVRPLIALQLPFLDCKKKALILCSWFYAHGIPFRLIAQSEYSDKEIHHVFPQILIDNEWYNTDATYPEFKLFDAKPMTTYAEEL